MQREDKGEEVEEGKPELTLHQLVEEIDAGYLSDLKPEDLPESEVSEQEDGNTEEEKTEEGEVDDKVSSELSPKVEEVEDPEVEIKDIDDTPCQRNYEFMTEFVRTYSEDAQRAKTSYYLQKLKFNINDERGKVQLHNMLKRYLTGLQWVMFYYYTGARHWRWYYPYHYAPMISDLGTDLLTSYLDGKNTITEFPVDTNCSANPAPYTPF